jgi:hypothetical protein
MQLLKVIYKYNIDFAKVNQKSPYNRKPGPIFFEDWSGKGPPFRRGLPGTAEVPLSTDGWATLSGSF